MMDPKDQRNEAEYGASLEQDLLAIREILSDEEPPTLLDQAVLNSARRDLTPKKRSPARWLGAFATASVVVLAVTIVVQQENTPSPLDTDRLDGFERSQNSEPEAVQQQKDRASSSADTIGSVTEARAKEDARQRSTPPSQNAPLKRKAEADLNKAGDSVASPAPTTSNAAQLSDESFRIADDKRVSPATSASVEEVLIEANEQDGLTVTGSRYSDDDREESVATPAPLELEEAKQSADIEPDFAEPWTRDPSVWVERLQSLNQNQQTEQLRLELEAFQIAYPDYPLPAELTDARE